jgi:predicted O-methyltransferase YrrM
MTREPVGTVAWKKELPSWRRAAESVVARAGALAGIRVQRLESGPRAVPPEATTLVEMMSRFDSIPGMVSLERGLLLYLLAFAAGPDGDIVEIGSWQGRSTAFLAQACEDADRGVVHAIDWFRGNPGKEHLLPVPLEEMEQAFRANIEGAGLSHRVVVHAKRAEDARPEVSGPLRMLFIDGAHTHEGVSSDLEYAALLAPGGVLVFDDYSDTFPGVVSAADGFLGRGGFSRAFVGRGFLIARRKS